MQTVLDLPTTHTGAVSQADAQGVACAYVAAHLDPALEVVAGERYASQPLGREIWRFFLRSPQGPVGAVRVDAQTGEVIRLTDAEIQVLHEKAAILAARKQGVLPVNAQGYVLGEYARRRAERYLGDYLAMFFNATDPIFVPGDPPCWQVTIVFKRYHLGPFTLGIMDVNAHTGEPLPLTKPQLKRLRERAHALVAFHTPSTAPAV
jgi:hypothetical protein